MSTKQGSVWLFSRVVDLGVMLIPVWLIWIVSFSLPETWLNADVPLWVWIVFILGIDVSHVWSTLFRTYLDKEEFHNHRQLLTWAPVVCFAICFLLAGWSVHWFWRILAYFAVFHFIKQQYGFLALYKLRSGVRLTKRFFRDKWVIYASMLYPVLYWHVTDDRAFSWFVQGDFLPLHLSESVLAGASAILNPLYFVMLAGWLVEEVQASRTAGKAVRWGVIAWMLTTAGNWYLGIVYFNSDLVFSLTNVVAHGLPYFALIAFYVTAKRQAQSEDLIPVKRHATMIVIMAVSVLALAFSEEYLWDMLLFRERSTFFEALFQFPVAAFESAWGQAFAFALLALPQTTHYLVDGFIWKNSPKNPFLKTLFSPR